MSEEQLGEIRDAFEFFDTDRSGEIDKNEMHEAMKVSATPCAQPLPPTLSRCIVSVHYALSTSRVLTRSFWPSLAAVVIAVCRVSLSLSLIRPWASSAR